MSRKSFAAARRSVLLDSAIAPLFEGLEKRNLFTNVAPVADLGGPYSLAEGQSVQISGLASTDSDGTIDQYQWDTNYSASRGFRHKLTRPTWNFTADDSGTRTIALRVVDNEGAMSPVQTATISITDVAPTLTLNLPGDAKEATATPITWSYTDPGVSDAVTAWTVNWGDGTSTNYAGAATGGSHVYVEAGTFTVSLTSTQADAITTVSQSLTVSHVTPVVVVQTPNNTVDEGANARVNFYSPNRDGTLDGWTVNWGDGNEDVMSASRGHANHAYGDNGTYTVTVTAQEPDGGTGSNTLSFTVANVAPTVTQTGVPATGFEGSAIPVGSTATDAGTADMTAGLTYGWTIYRNGAVYTPTVGTVLNAPGLTFTPTDNGSYVLRLSVVDKDGGIKTVNSDPIVVANVNPTASIGGTPGSIVEGTAVNLTATANDAGSEDVAGLTYAWSVTKGGVAYPLPVGTVTNAAAFSFTPRDNGAYVATVLVKDKDNGTRSVSTTAITVTNATPTAAVGGQVGTGNEGSGIPLTADVTDAGIDDTHTYQWSVEKLTPGTGGQVTVTGTSATSLGNYDWGTDFTVTARVKVPASAPNGTRPILMDYNSDMKLALVKSGGNIGLYLINDDNTENVYTAASLPVDTFLDIAVTYNDATGATAMYVNGQALSTSGFLSPGLGDARVTHFVSNFTGTYDQLAVYHSELSAADVADLYVGNTITTPAYDLWDFSEAPGSTATTSTGTNGKTFNLYNATFGTPATWTSVAVPLGTNTAGATFDYVPQDNGTYRVKLLVTDKDGATADAQTSDIVVGNVNPTAAITGVLAENAEGTAITLGSTSADAGPADTTAGLTYAWSVTKDGSAYALPGGTATAGQGFTFTPTNDGAYVVSLTVTDKDGGNVVTTQNITVTNLPPVPTINGTPVSGQSDEGVALNFTSSVTDAGNDAIASYAWSVTKDNVAYTLPGGTVTNAASFGFTPGDNGTYVVSLSVVDADGGTGTDSKTVTVNNVAPTGSLTSVPGMAVDAGLPITLGTSVSDVVADTFTYAWNVTKNGIAYALPLGTVANADSFTFTPDGYGTYAVSCVVTDDDGGHETFASGDMVVQNVAPLVTVTNAATGTEGTALTATSTVVDALADTHTYAWSVESFDGSVWQPVALPAGAATTDSDFSFTPADNGTYRLKLMVVDDGGLDATVYGQDVAVANAAPTVSVTIITTGLEGTQIDLTATAADAGTADVASLTYAWSVLKNGSAYGTGGTTADFSFTPDNDGTYAVTCLVTDKDGDSSSTTQTIVVANVDPTANITGFTGSPMEGTNVAMTSNAADAGNDVLTYAWSVVKDGQAYALPVGTVTDASGFNFAPADNGSYEVTVVVSDPDGGSVTKTKSFTVVNRDPTATMSGEPTGSIVEGAAVNLTATASDVAADTLSYAWTVTKDSQPYALPIGTVSNAAGFDFTPDSDGTYVVTCVVSDEDDGSTSVDGQSIVVTNRTPTATIAANGVGSEGTAVTSSAVVTDGPQDTHTYLWTVQKLVDVTGTPTWANYALPEGTADTNASFSFTPSDNGTYRTTLLVTDNGGASSTAHSGDIVVANVDPTISIAGPSTGFENGTVTLTTEIADAGSLDTHTYAWTATRDGQAYAFPVGTVLNAATLEFVPDDQGTYDITCTVNDQDGGSDSATHGIAVANLNPVVSVTSPADTTEGSGLTFTSEASDAAGDTLTYGWTVYRNGQSYTLPQGTVTNAASLTFTPDDDGSYVARLTVIDEDGGITTRNSSPVAVGDVPPVVTITGETVAPEGAALSFNGSATDVSDADTDAGFHYLWTVKRGSKVVANGDEQHFAYTPTVHGDYTVTLKVTDKDGRSTTQQSSLTVGNVAPTEVTLTGTRQGLVEGNTVSLTAGAHDASGDTLSYAWQAVRNGQVFASGTTSDVTFAAARGSYDITVTATDTGGETATQTFAMVVGNVPPTGVIAAPEGNVLLGTTAQFGLTVTDVPARQPLEVSFDYGDGSPVVNFSTVSGQILPLKHKYAAVRGTYTVTATINDGITTTTLTKQVTVSEAAMIADPQDPTKQALVVIGSDANDVITVSPTEGGKYGVVFNGTSLGSAFNPDGRAYVYGNKGANTITVNGSVNAVVFAGEKASSVTTGSGNDYISGSDGADKLNGGAGNDMVIGGSGPDTIHGGAGEDLVLAGIHTLANDSAKSVAALNAWTSAANITARKNAMKTLFSKQLVNDAGANQLFGDAGNDWFVFNAKADKLKDQQATDLVN